MVIYNAQISIYIPIHLKRRAGVFTFSRVVFFLALPYYERDNNVPKTSRQFKTLIDTFFVPHTHFLVQLYLLISPTIPTF